MSITFLNTNQVITIADARALLRYTAAEKNKLAGIAAGAEVNRDAQAAYNLIEDLLYMGPETGAWNPTITMPSGFAASEVQGTYERNGDLVRFDAKLRVSRSSGDWQSVAPVLSLPDGSAAESMSGKAEGAAGGQIKTENVYSMEFAVSRVLSDVASDHVTTMAWHEGLLYYGSQGGASHLYSINTSSGIETDIGTITLISDNNLQQLRAMASLNNILYAMILDGSGDVWLCTLNPSNAQLTEITTDELGTFFNLISSMTRNQDDSGLLGLRSHSSSPQLKEINVSDGTIENTIPLDSVWDNASGLVKYDVMLDSAIRRSTYYVVQNGDLYRASYDLSRIDLVNDSGTFNPPLAVSNDTIWSPNGSDLIGYRPLIYGQTLMFGDDEFTTGIGYIDESGNKIRVNFDKVVEDGNDAIIDIEGSYIVSS